MQRSSEQIKDYLSLGNIVEYVRIDKVWGDHFPKKGWMPIFCGFDCEEWEIKTARGRDRVWTSLDTLIDYLDRLGVPVNGNLEIQIR
jgi:hypothetical protein